MLISEKKGKQFIKNCTLCGVKYKLAKAVDFIHFTVDKIQEKKRSPNSVCGNFKTNGMFPNNLLSTKTLYNYIDVGLLPVKNIYLPLKIRRKPKKKRNHKKQLVKVLKNNPLALRNVKN